MATKATTNKFSPEVRERVVRMVQGHVGKHPTRWAAVQSIAAEIGCAAQTLHDWTKKAEVDGGKGSVKNLGHYAASWKAGWPKRPSSTAALT